MRNPHPANLSRMLTETDTEGSHYYKRWRGAQEHVSKKSQGRERMAKLAQGNPSELERTGHFGMKGID